MKLTTALMCIGIFSVSAHGFSQETKVTISLHKVKLIRLFKAIEKETDYRFTFSNDIIPNGRIVTVNVNDVPVSQVLTGVFASTRLKFRFADESGTIIISEKTEEDFKETLIPAAVIITGKVTNPKGEPLPGVTVQVKGTSRATTTVEDGTFSFDVGENAKTLVFSYVGMEVQEISIAGNTNVQVQMKPVDNNLDAVVVVGYGTQRSRNVSGAVARISAKEISQVAVVSADQAILGRVAGVQVSQNSGEPGGEISIRIRGIASITSGSDPLIVVDGIPLSVNLRAINPNDIESIDVLKDAAASAIYGSRASAGVILITTKRGKAGKVAINLDAYTGIQNVIKTIPVLNGPEYAKLANENLVNGGQAPNPAWANPASMPTTDWQDALFRTASMNNYNVSISGGNEKARTFVSFGYTKQDGIIQRSTYERFTSRINMDYDVSRRLKIGVNVNFNFDKNRNPTTQNTDAGVLIGAPNGVLQANPTDPVYTTTEGQLGDHLFGFRGYAMRSNDRPTAFYITTNPIWRNDYYTEITRGQNTELLSNAFGEVELIKGLKFKSIISYNIANSIGIYGQPYKLPAVLDPQSNSSYQQGWNKGTQWNWVNTLNYERTFGDHNVSLLVGTDALKGTGAYIQGNGTGQPENQQSLTATTSNNRVAGNAYVPFSLFSYLSRLNYNYKEKYLVSFNFRRDGSSKFAEENRYGYFPSVSAAWRISKEGFMQSVGFIQELKLRASYGSVGNQNIPDLQFLSTYTNNGGRYGYSLGTPTGFVGGISPGVLGNSDISWEKNTEKNIGLDAIFGNGMFNLSADYYQKELTDLLGTVPTPFYSTPFNGSFLANAFSMENKGIELLLGFNKRVGEVKFNASANFTTISNKVTGLIPGNTSGYLPQSISVIGNLDGAETRTYVGEKVGNYWGYIFDGIIQNAAELAASGMEGLGSKVGDKRFKDINGRDAKGNLTGQPDGKVNGDDKTFIGNGIPGYVYGFNLGVEYKGFDLNVFFNGQGDVQIANMTKAIMYHMKFHNGPGITNVNKAVLNSWKGEGTSNTLPRNSYDAPYINRAFATDYIENGAFLRLRNIQLGYTLPASIAKRAAMTRARIYVSAQNLFTITNYSGYDPEVGSSTVGNRVQTAGADFGRYPSARMFTFGISAQF